MKCTDIVKLKMKFLFLKQLKLFLLITCKQFLFPAENIHLSGIKLELVYNLFVF